MKKRIHVNQHNIKFNRMLAQQLELYPDDPTKPKPVLTVKTYKSNHKVNHVVVTHEKKIVGILSSFDLLKLVEEHRFTMKPGANGK